MRINEDFVNENPIKINSIRCDGKFQLVSIDRTRGRANESNVRRLKRKKNHMSWAYGRARRTEKRRWADNTQMNAEQANCKL